MSNRFVSMQSQWPIGNNCFNYRAMECTRFLGGSCQRRSWERVIASS